MSARDLGEPCTASGDILASDPIDVLFRPCGTCGHVRLMHRSRHNPAVESCVLCRLEALTRQEGAS